MVAPRAAPAFGRVHEPSADAVIARGLADDEGVDEEADQGGSARRVQGGARGGLRDGGDEIADDVAGRVSHHDVAGRVSHHDESVGGGEMEEAVF